MRKLFMFMIAILPSQVESKTEAPADPITNLVIINDLLEISSTIPILSTIKLQAIQTNLLTSLMQNQLVLCPKALWLTIQNFYESWMQTVNNQASNEFDKQAQLLYETYTNLQTKIPHIAKQDRLAEIQKTIEEYSQKTNLINPSNLGLLNQPFWAFMCYNIIVNNEYSCKEVDDIFILFIPKDIAQSEELPDFRYKTLKDFDYRNRPNPTKYEEIFQQALTCTDLLGKKLLDALRVLIPPVYTRPLKENNLKTHWFNFFITGHGFDNLTAEISTTLAVDEHNNIKRPISSDLLSILNFFNYHIATKTVTFFSCHPGGKKLVKAFDIENQFNNLPLEQLNYTIINVGSFNTRINAFNQVFNPIHELSHLTLYDNDTIIGPDNQDLIPDIEQMFKYLNIPSSKDASYQKAYEQIAKLLLPQHNVTSFSFNNHINVKFPHTAWFSPAEISKQTMTITQTNSLTQDTAPFVIPDNIKVVFLAANYIKNIKIEKRTDLQNPFFLPANYVNQNYVIDHLEINLNWIESSDKQVIQDRIKKSFFPLENCREEINLFIKNVTVNKSFDQSSVSFGNMILSIPGNGATQWLFPDNTLTKPLGASIEREAKKNLKDISAVKKFLEQKLKNPYQQAQQSKNSFKNSHRRQEQEQLSKILTTVKSLQDSAKSRQRFETQEQLSKILMLVKSL